MDAKSFTSHLRNPAAFVADLLRIAGPDTSESAPDVLTFGAPRWDVIAQIEDDRSEFPEEERIRSRHLDEMIETFDPEFRRVPWVAGLKSGGGPGDAEPSHWSVGPPVAEIVELDRDRINLWAKTLPIIDPSTGKDRFASIVANGYTERSIGFATKAKETGGKAQLIHVAALSMAEAPGIPNMPRLDRVATSKQLLSAFGKSLPEIDLSRVAQDWKLLGGEPSEALSLRSRVFLNSAAHEAEEEFQVELSKEALEQIGGLVKSNVESIGSKITESVTSSLAALEKRIEQSEQQTQALEAKLEDTATEAAEAKEAAEKKDEEERTKQRGSLMQRLSKAVNQGVASGRQRSKIEALLEALPEADQLTEKDVVLFERALDLQPIVIGRSLIEEVKTVAGESVQVNLREYQLGDGESQLSAEGLETLSELMASTGYDPSNPDPDKFRAFEREALRREQQGLL